VKRRHIFLTHLYSPPSQTHTVLPAPLGIAPHMV
jgi:hypothetical protein